MNNTLVNAENVIGISAMFEPETLETWSRALKTRILS